MAFLSRTNTGMKSKSFLTYLRYNLSFHHTYIVTLCYTHAHIHTQTESLPNKSINAYFTQNVHSYASKQTEL